MNDELQGTFACSVCGVAEPHYHDIAYINKRRVEEAVLRPRFEQLLHNLMQGGQPFSELRVSGWGNPVFWSKRWETPTIETPAAYRDAKAEALWQFFLRTHYAAADGVAAAPAVPDHIARDVEQCESADRWNDGVPFKSRWERKLYENGFAAGWDRARAVEAERTAGVVASGDGPPKGGA